MSLRFGFPDLLTGMLGNPCLHFVYQLLDRHQTVTLAVIVVRLFARATDTR